ncbi:MAG: polysaccharide lyase family 1 protein [Dysgonomonas sp.]
MKKIYIFLSFILFFCTIYAQIPAFPGAEGGGRYVTGGRGGTVYYVNSLEDTLEGNETTREGTLRWCIERPGAKIILFKVAGIIWLNNKLEIRDNTTIAGQTAPGDGICIAKNTVRVVGDNVIIRFIRFRLGDLAKVEDDALYGMRQKNIIIDHCSMSWSTDECSSFYDNDNFTMQWCILSESLRGSVHWKGSHGYGGIWGGRKASFHHNLLAHHDNRNPRLCGARYSDRADEELVDLRNNVIYNWGQNSGYAGEGGRYNFINNYYKPSKTSSFPNRIFSPNADIGANRQRAGVWGKFYLSGNYVYGSEETTQDNVLGFQPEPATKDKKDLLSDMPFDVPLVETDPAEVAYERVLAHVGASYKRDRTDARVVDEVRNGLTPVRASGNVKTRPGMIDSQKDVGGWEEYTYNSVDVVKDSDIDGIPDGWLEQNYPGKKASDLNEEGYPYLEVYLNSLVNHVFDK